MRTENGPASEAPKPIFLKDYRQPDFWISKVDLRFNLGALADDVTVVKSKLYLERNLKQERSRLAPLVLNGESLKLISVAVDGSPLDGQQYTVHPDRLELRSLPDRFVLEIETEIDPRKNLSCEGLYKSGGMFCTQCEAESFRRITYFLDRPDVMSVYTVTIEANKATYPVLLSNGNPIARKDLAGGRHEIVWHDPHKKPCYLFALVAGDLGVLEDRYKTTSGRDVALKIYARHGFEERCHHAMQSLKWSLKWDEDTYGLEYDLDIFMIVVAEDFNMGAMENKGLNIFNANYVLADTKTATDHDFNAVTSVVGHEYFHNWTGNRVTCRDWFQLSLKEGLTVFRDQRFSGDLGSEAVNRIEEIIRLRTHQFAEDAGPTAHPVRPQSYISIDNFYTLTVYEKGAEVIRMIETLLGREGFRRGMDLYFSRHDGQAVTTEDFVQAMADATGTDLTQFKNWYDQAGTPLITVRTEHDEKKSLFHITIAQSAGANQGSTEAPRKAFHIPIAVGLVGKDGKDQPLHLQGLQAQPAKTNGTTAILELREEEQTFTFTGIKEKPVLSLLRGFSAPVKVEYHNGNDELAFLIAHDSDPYCRWEAAQTLVCRVVQDLVGDFQAGKPLRDPVHLVKAFASLLQDQNADPAFISFMLALPAEQYLAQFFQTIDVDGIFAAREHIMLSIAKAQHIWFKAKYRELLAQGTEGFGPEPYGRRALKNRVLEYIVMAGGPEDLQLALTQQRDAKNMTEEIGALEALNRIAGLERKAALHDFYQKWQNEPLVMNKWLTVQAISPLADTLETIQTLSRDRVFDKNNPNKIYSLYAAFCRFNQLRFHDRSGAGYRFIGDRVLEVDSRNPQVAARLMSGFSQWRSFDHDRQNLIKAELKRILAHTGLSNNVFELASKMLGSD